MDHQEEDEDQQSRTEMCSSCKQPLVIAPIFAYKTKFVCGRCNVDNYKKDSPSVYARQYLYENLKRFETALCPNYMIGCDVELPPAEITSHLEVCLLGKMRCPFTYPSLEDLNEDCGWIGFIKEFEDHFYKHHGSFVVHKLAFAIIDKSIVMSINIRGQFFTVVVLGSTAKKYIVIIGTKSWANLFRCQLHLFNDKKTKSVTLRNNKVADYGEMAAMLDKQEGLFEIDLGDYAETLNFPCKFTALINIQLKQKKFLRELLPEDECGRVIVPNFYNKQNEPRKMFDEIVRDEFICANCKEPMFKPIFICKDGFSYCNTCKENSEVCPLCNTMDSGVRNHTLENIASCIDFPCHNTRFDCDFFGYPEELQKHQRGCTSADRECFLQCSFKGNFKLTIGHIKTSHVKSLFAIDQTYSVNAREHTKYECYAVIGKDEIFRLGFKNDLGGRGEMKFYIQRVGFCLSGQYYYEIEIIDLRKTGVKMNIVNLCVPITFDRDVKRLFEKGTIIPKDSLKPFILNNSVSYKINLIKKDIV